jgi:hypothetical protein
MNEEITMLRDLLRSERKKFAEERADLKAQCAEKESALQVW